MTDKERHGQCGVDETNPVPSATGNRGAGLEAEAEAGNLAFFSAARPTRGALMVAATGVM